MVDFVGLRSSACSMKHEHCCLQEYNDTDTHIINHLRMPTSSKFRTLLYLGRSAKERNLYGLLSSSKAL